MNEKISRRDIFKFLGGTAAGLMLSPVPWKLLDDVTIWTQNWPWIPTPIQGEMRTRFTTCSLCPTGCGMKVRCVGQQPIGLAGVPSHPVSQGGLCPLGVTGHHTPWHPARILSPAKIRRRGDSVELETTSVQTILAEVAAAISEMRRSDSRESVALLEQRPGRTLSLAYRQFLTQMPNGMYIGCGSRDDASFKILQELLEKPFQPLGYDLENTRTILSLGSPVLDSWAAPLRAGQLIKLRGQRGLDDRVKIIQVESRQSRAAAVADEWIPIRPGTEMAFVLGLAYVLIQERLYDESTVRQATVDFRKGSGKSFENLVSQFTPARVSGITGVSPEEIVSLAIELGRRGPSLVIGGGDPVSGPVGREEEMAIWGLNVLLGAVGKSGGVIRRAEIPEIATSKNADLSPVLSLEEVPDKSIRILLLDGDESGLVLPWSLLERKLSPNNPLIVSLSSFVDEIARHANYIIPTPTFLEAFQEMPSPSGSSFVSLAIAAPVVTAPKGVIEPIGFLKGLAEATGADTPALLKATGLGDLIRRRVDLLFKRKQGSLFIPNEETVTQVSSLASSDQLWKGLTEGGCWFDRTRMPAGVPRFAFLGRTSGGYDRMMAKAEGRLKVTAPERNSPSVVLIPYGCRGATANPGSPLLTKLYQESGLNCPPNQASINPATGTVCGLKDGGRASLESKVGAFVVNVHFNSSVMPGVILVSVAPDRASFFEPNLTDAKSILSICEVTDDSTWRITQVRVREA